MNKLPNYPYGTSAVSIGLHLMVLTVITYFNPVLGYAYVIMLLAMSIQLDKMELKELNSKISRIEQSKGTREEYYKEKYGLHSLDRLEMKVEESYYNNLLKEKTEMHKMIKMKIISGGIILTAIIGFGIFLSVQGII